MTHAGVRFGVPSKLVLAVQSYDPQVKTLALWNGPLESADAGARLFVLKTAKGPRAVRGTGAQVAWLAPNAISPITPFLRRFMSSPYIVGLAELEGSFTWLVDPGRLVPDDAGEADEASFFA